MSQCENASFKYEKLRATCFPMSEYITSNQRIDSIVLHKGVFPKCKSLHSRKSFVLGELSFARMPSRQYCLKVNKVHSCN